MTHLNPLSSYSLFLQPYHVSKLAVFLTAENVPLMVLSSWGFVFSCIPRVCTMSCADWGFRKYLLNQSVVTFPSSSCTEYSLRPYTMPFISISCLTHGGYCQQTPVNNQYELYAAHWANSHCFYSTRQCSGSIKHGFYSSDL